jgi:hypothetical protein
VAPAPQLPTEACPLCGAPLAAEQEWCLRCGAAARTRLAAAPSWKGPLLAGAVVAALALGVLAAGLVKLAGDTGPAPAPITRTVTGPAAAITPTTVLPGASTTAPATPAPATTAPAGSGATGQPTTSAPTSTTPSTPATGGANTTKAAKPKRPGSTTR